MKLHHLYYLFAAISVGVALACAPTEEDYARQQELKKEYLWGLAGTQSNGTPGPWTYASQHKIDMADGTQVVCVSTHNALWCKEAQ
jgi:hypothetical protein